MSIVHRDGQQDLLNEAVEAHQIGRLFVARSVGPGGPN